MATPSQRAAPNAVAPPLELGLHAATEVATVCGKEAEAQDTEGEGTQGGVAPPSSMLPCAKDGTGGAAGDAVDPADSGSADETAGALCPGGAAAFGALDTDGSLGVLWCATGFAAWPNTVAACGAGAAPPGPNRCMHP